MLKSKLNNFLIFSHEFPPDQGGEGTYSLELAKGICNLGYKVTVLCGKPINKESKYLSFDNELINDGIKIIRHDWINKDRFWFINSRKTLLKVLASDNSINHIFFANFTSCVIGHQLYDKIKIPYSITIHGDDIDYFFSNNIFSKRRWKSFILINRKKSNEFFKKAKKIICVSRYAKERLMSNSPDNINPIVIHHGIENKNIENIKLNKKKIIKKYKINKDQTIIVYLSRVAHKKGHDLLIDILSKNKVLEKKVHTIFVGSGPKLIKLQKKVIKNKLTNITFTGALPRNKALEILSASDFSLLLSENKNETFGLVILEAMSLKKPVIVLNHGGMVETIEDGTTGFIVEKNDVANKIQFLVNNPEICKIMGENAEKSYSMNFTNKRMATETLEHIQ